MSDLLHPAGTLADGPDPLRITAADAGWQYCGLQVLALQPDETRQLTLAGVEAAVVPLEGDVSVGGGGLDATLRGRDDVFEGPPDVAYLTLGADVALRSPAGGRVAVCSARAEEQRPSFVVAREQISHDVRGAGQATRAIRGLLSADVEGPQRLIVVEVITPAGNWSSYPPHKHDEWSDDEVPIEEIYYFEIAGEDGFGFHRTYTTDGAIDETVTVRDRDLFLVPRGYHGPCVAAPGYDMYYLNVMAGPDPERRWLICNDPTHEWVMDQWAEEPVDPRASEGAS